MIYKRNRVYFTDTDIIKIYSYFEKNFIEDYTFEKIIPFDKFIKDIGLWYKFFRNNYMIKKPNITYVLYYVKYGVYGIEDKNYQINIMKLNKYVDLYRNDEWKDKYEWY